MSRVHTDEDAEWLKPYRTRDESGSPTDAGTVGWNWISELAQRERADDATLLNIECTPVQGGGKVSRLYRGTKLLAVATTFRDEQNFTVLVRWRERLTSKPADDGGAK